MATDEKFSPHSQEAEEAVLGSVLINPDAITDITAILLVEDFFIVKNAWVWSAILTIAERQQAVDTLTVTEELRARGQLDSIGGAAYVLYLSNNTPTHIHAETYARIVERAAIRRRLLAAASDIAQTALQEDTEISDVLAHVEETVTSAIVRDNSSDIYRLRDLNDAYFRRTDALSQDPGSSTLVATGYPALDSIIDGVDKGELALVAARPSVGKTALLINMAIKAAIRGLRVGIFSMEQDREKITGRIAGILSGVNTRTLKKGTLNEHEWDKYVRVQGLINSLPIFIDDTPGMRPSQLRSKVAQMRRKFGLDMVCVDYLGLMHTGRKKDENRNAEISYICRQLKEGARTSRLPFFVAAQLNRESAKAGNRPPQLSDLRDSGAQEQDADLVMMLHREGVADDALANPYKLKVYIRKNRDGETGACDLLYEPAYTRFLNYEENSINLNL